MKINLCETSIDKICKSIDTMKDFCYSFERTNQFNYESLLPIKLKRDRDLIDIIDKYYKIY